MNPTPEMQHSAAGLIYRMRPGQPHAGMIVMLHGLGGDEDVMWIFEQALPRAATIIAPRALYISELGGYSWARSVDRDDLDDVDFQPALYHLSRFLAETMAAQRSDPRQVIMLGFSQGAALSYAHSLAQPEMMRGVIALAGFLPSALPALPSTDQVLPHYLILHGSEDEAVPVARARAARKVLESYGASVEYHEHRVGHKVSAQGIKEMARWIAKNLREG